MGRKQWFQGYKNIRYLDSLSMEEYKFRFEKLQKPSEKEEGTKSCCVLISCGSFNPVTFAHTRNFESARDILHREHKIKVIGGFISPTNDSYEKKGLLRAHHRTKMVELAVGRNDWVNIDTWESLQREFMTIRSVLEHFETELKNHFDEEKYEIHNVNVFLLGGADLLGAMKSSKFDPKDVEYILQHFGIVIIERDGYDIDEIIKENQILDRNSDKIFRVPMFIQNDISSTKIRDLIKQRFSTKYYVEDCVREYIENRNLYIEN